MKNICSLGAAPLLAALLLLLLLQASATAEAEAPEQCYGHDPQQGVSSFLGATLDYSVADRICCHNHRYAERWGYLQAPEVDLFNRLDPDVETVFYDSVCGLPLFVAPRNRTFEEFKEESLKHGWPSFRPAELVSENVVIHDDGRMESKCLTHLGHNLPEGGVDRYCIDLVCVAGAPLPSDDARVAQVLSEDPAVVAADELDVGAYVSSAEQSSGKQSNVGRKVLIGVVTVAAAIAAGAAVFFVRRSWNNNSKNKKAGPVDASGKGGDAAS